MKAYKLFLIACAIACANSATTLLPSRTENPVKQLVRIMMSNTKDQPPYILTENRNPNEYQDIYNLAIKHPKLLKGIIHDGRTFAVLCVERGYADVLQRLINEDYLVDLATPCRLLGPGEPESTVLHVLFFEIRKSRKSKIMFGGKYPYPEDYTAHITALTKLILNKYPELLDIPVDHEKTARDYALHYTGGIYECPLGDLISRNVPQSSSE